MFRFASILLFGSGIRSLKMNKFRMLFPVLAVVALVTSAYGFKVTNVTNDEVVFSCSWE